jgi:A nuclease family of the HNH/ENDO VII superfamily with conserved AHH
LLWKIYCNAEVSSEKYPDLWDQFRTDLSKAPSQPMGIVKGEPLPPLSGFGEGPSIAPELLKPETFPSSGATLPPLGGFGEGPSIAPELLKPETFPSGGATLPPLGGFDEGLQPEVDNVLMSTGTVAPKAKVQWTQDHRKNYERAHGSIPAGHQIHHLAPQAVYRDSKLAQEWTKRGITGVHYPENLEALPQTQGAYDKSKVKIQHSGSHGKWSDHAEEVLAEEQDRLIDQYGSLDKVPDNVMKLRKDEIMQELREDLLDKDLGLDKGWVQPKPSGMDKLSQAQDPTQIG